jgi:quinol-cytochrome oxidoreductase complex cytochrome b subunit
MQFLKFLQFFLIKSLVLFDKLLFIRLLLFLTLLDLSFETCAIRNPVNVGLFMGLPDEIILDSVFGLGLPPEIKEIVNVIEFVMCFLHVLFKTLQLKVDLKPLLPTNIAIGLFILLCRVALFSEFSKLIYNGA